MSAPGQDGYWVVSVNRATGHAVTSELIADADEAWQRSIDTESPNVFTTVVGRRTTGRRL